MMQEKITQEMFVPVSSDAHKQEYIARKHHSAFYDGWVRLRKNKAAVVCAVLIIVIAVMLTALGCAIVLTKIRTR